MKLSYQGHSLLFAGGMEGLAAERMHGRTLILPMMNSAMHYKMTHHGTNIIYS